MISFLESLIGAGPVFLIAATLVKLEPLQEWTYSQVLLLLFIPICLVHWAVVSQFLRVFKHP